MVISYGYFEKCISCLARCGLNSIDQNCTHMHASSNKRKRQRTQQNPLQIVQIDECLGLCVPACHRHCRCSAPHSLDAKHHSFHLFICLHFVLFNFVRLLGYLFCPCLPLFLFLHSRSCLWFRPFVFHSVVLRFFLLLLLFVAAFNLSNNKFMNFTYGQRSFLRRMHFGGRFDNKTTELVGLCERASERASARSLAHTRVLFLVSSSALCSFLRPCRFYLQTKCIINNCR